MDTQNNRSKNVPKVQDTLVRQTEEEIRKQKRWQKHQRFHANNPNKNREYCHRYYQGHQQTRCNKQKIYYADNKEEVKKYQQSYRKQNRKQLQIIRQIDYKLNPQKYKDRAKQYHRNHRQEKIEYMKKYKEKVRDEAYEA